MPLAPGGLRVGGHHEGGERDVPAGRTRRCARGTRTVTCCGLDSRTHDGHQHERAHALGREFGGDALLAAVTEDQRVGAVAHKRRCSQERAGHRRVTLAVRRFARVLRQDQGLARPLRPRYHRRKSRADAYRNDLERQRQGATRVPDITRIQGTDHLAQQCFLGPGIKGRTVQPCVLERDAKLTPDQDQHAQFLLVPAVGPFAQSRERADRAPLRHERDNCEGVCPLRGVLAAEGLALASDDGVSGIRGRYAVPGHPPHQRLCQALHRSARLGLGRDDKALRGQIGGGEHVQLRRTHVEDASNQAGSPLRGVFLVHRSAEGERDGVDRRKVPVLRLQVSRLPRDLLVQLLVPAPQLIARLGQQCLRNVEVGGRHLDVVTRTAEPSGRRVRDGGDGGEAKPRDEHDRSGDQFGLVGQDAGECNVFVPHEERAVRNQPRNLPQQHRRKGQ